MTRRAQHLAARRDDRVSAILLQVLAEGVVDRDEIPGLAPSWSSRRRAHGRAHRCQVQCTKFFEHCGPVMIEIGAGGDHRLVLSLATASTASATGEPGRSMMTSTPSWSIHLRAMPEPMSGLF